MNGFTGQSVVITFLIFYWCVPGNCNSLIRFSEILWLIFRGYNSAHSFVFVCAQSDHKSEQSMCALVFIYRVN